MVLGLILIPLLWFGIPALTSNSPFSAATLAERSPRALRGDRMTGTVGRFLALNPTIIKVAAALAAVLAVVRRDRAVLLLTGGVVLWVAVEVAFALHGWSAVPRYIYEAAAGVDVLAGVAIGRVILDFPVAAMRIRPGPRGATAGGVGGLIVVLAFAAALVPVLHGRIAAERKDLRGQRVRASYVNRLAGGVAHLGAARILACGQPNIGLGWQSILAWQFGTNTGTLFFLRSSETVHRHPIVNMHPHSYGWRFLASDWTNAAQAARCRGLAYRT
jgi:hypothetical protein